MAAPFRRRGQAHASDMLAPWRNPRNQYSLAPPRCTFICPHGTYVKYEDLLRYFATWKPCDLCVDDLMRYQIAFGDFAVDDLSSDRRGYGLRFHGTSAWDYKGIAEGSPHFSMTERDRRVLLGMNFAGSQGRRPHLIGVFAFG